MTKNNKNLKIEIGDLADYLEDLVLVTTLNKTGQRPIPELLGKTFPIR